MVYDHVSNNDVKFQEFKAPKALMKEVKLAHQYLKKVKASKKRQKELIHGQIIEIKSQKQYVMRCIEVLSSDGNQLSLEAKQKRDFPVLVKTNALRAKEKEKEKKLTKP